MKINTREIALHILEQVENEQAYANVLLESNLRREAPGKQDRAFLTQLVYGVLRRRGRLDWILGQVGNRPLSQLDPWIRNILRLGAYQLLELGGVAPYAAINESVELARHHGHAGTANLVNAVLRNIQRQEKPLTWPDKQKFPADYLAVEYSLPKWLAQRWLERYGLEDARALGEAAGKYLPQVIRVNTLKITPQLLQKDLDGLGWKPSPGLWPEAITLESAHGITEAEPYAKGLYEVESTASMQAVRLLDARPGERVLDACAGRGVKTGHLAQIMENRGQIIALDNQPRKLQQVRGNCQRLGVNIVQPMVHDVALGLKLIHGVFDRILVDAPCSSLGVIARYPELRWQRRAEDISRLSKLQGDILASAAAALKPGGVIVYSVCSFEPEENEGVILPFLKAHPEYKVDDPHPYLAREFSEAVTPDGFVRLPPHKYQTDGFFMARLCRGGRPCPPPN